MNDLPGQANEYGLPGSDHASSRAARSRRIRDTTGAVAMLAATMTAGPTALDTLRRAPRPADPAAHYRVTDGCVAFLRAYAARG